MKLSPFLNMYVDYCFQFTSGVQALDEARRKRPQLERYIAQAAGYAYCGHAHTVTILTVAILAATHYHSRCVSISQAEKQIRNANLMQRGPAAAGVVSLFDYLIKPVQRLCQYPLLFREIAKEMKLLAEPAGGAAAGQRKKSVRFDLSGCGGGGGGSVSGGGVSGGNGGGGGEAWPRGGCAKARLVLQVLEDTVAGINDKVRQQQAKPNP